MGTLGNLLEFFFRVQLDNVCHKQMTAENSKTQTLIVTIGFVVSAEFHIWTFVFYPISLF